MFRQRARIIALLVRGVILAKPKDPSAPGKKNISENTKQCAINSNVAKHAWAFDHTIDFTGAKIIDTANNRTRKTLESWHTAKTAEADNNSCPLPKQYSILLKKH